MTIDAGRYKDFFANWPGAVAVITCRGADGVPQGFTASSFISLSLDPTLVLFAIKRSARSLPHFAAAEGFAVNALKAEQGELSTRFATPQPDKFAGLEYTEGAHTGAPLLKTVGASGVPHGAPVRRRRPRHLRGGSAVAGHGGSGPAGVPPAPLPSPSGLTPRGGRPGFGCLLWKDQKKPGRFMAIPAFHIPRRPPRRASTAPAELWGFGAEAVAALLFDAVHRAVGHGKQCVGRDAVFGKGG